MKSLLKVIADSSNFSHVLEALFALSSGELFPATRECMQNAKKCEFKFISAPESDDKKQVGWLERTAQDTKAITLLNLKSRSVR
jgi:hypothetical protein